MFETCCIFEIHLLLCFAAFLFEPDAVGKMESPLSDSILSLLQQASALANANLVSRESRAAKLVAPLSAQYLLALHLDGISAAVQLSRRRQDATAPQFAPNRVAHHPTRRPTLLAR
jgi:hypothetical protein